MLSHCINIAGRRDWNLSKRARRPPAAKLARLLLESPLRTDPARGSTDRTRAYSSLIRSRMMGMNERLVRSRVRRAYVIISLLVLGAPSSLIAQNPPKDTTKTFFTRRDL